MTSNEEYLLKRIELLEKRIEGLANIVKDVNGVTGKVNGCVGDLTDVVKRLITRVDVLQGTKPAPKKMSMGKAHLIQTLLVFAVIISIGGSTAATNPFVIGLGIVCGILGFVLLAVSLKRNA